MGAVAAAAAVIGAGVQIYGQLSAAEKQAEAQRREAELKQMQSDELLRRQAINEQVMRENVAQAELSTGTASGGITNTGIGQRLQMRKILARNISLSRQEAEWKSHMLRLGAAADQQLASDVLAAGGIGAAATGLGAAAEVGRYIHKSSPSQKTSSLPGVED